MKLACNTSNVKIVAIDQLHFFSSKFAKSTYFTSAVSFVKRKFQIILDVWEGKELCDLAKHPFNRYTNAAHGFIKFHLSRAFFGLQNGEMMF